MILDKIWPSIGETMRRNCQSGSKCAILLATTGDELFHLYQPHLILAFIVNSIWVTQTTIAAEHLLSFTKDRHGIKMPQDR